MELGEQAPPIPARPGRVVRQIQSIDSIRPDFTRTSNVYVDSNSLSTPKLPPRTNKHNIDKKVSLSKTLSSGGNERHENERNEQREARRLPPVLPPRGESARPPPIPSRMLQAPNIQAPVPQRMSERQSIRSVHVPAHQAGSSRSRLTNQTTVLILDSSKSRASRRTVTSQPSSSPPNFTLSMDKRTGEMKNSIICPKCGECRCSSCTADRELPERWLCQGNCRFSASSVVDALSCMCIARSLLHKYTFDNQHHNHNTTVESHHHPSEQTWPTELPRRGIDDSADICACMEKPNCCLRWSALTALSACLPCLCCYWPMQGGVTAATACYNSPCCRRKGCTCEGT